MTARHAIGIAALLVASGAIAQDRRGDPSAEQPQPSPPSLPVTRSPSTGQVAQSSAGQAGRRQTRDQALAEGIEPLARIATRIQNRVQNRLRTRIDRSYDPQAVSPFEVAEDQARTAARPRR